MMHGDDEIQDALDRRGREGMPAAGSGDAGDADRAAYEVVYAALADDAGFALPPDFAEAVAARVMPLPARASVYERWVLPALLFTSSAIALPVVLPQVFRGIELAYGAPENFLPQVLQALLALAAVAAADRLVRRWGWAPAV